MSEQTPANELLSCPFCGAGETVVEADSKHWTGMQWSVLSYRVQHWCAGSAGWATRITVRAKTEQEARDKWNKRT